MRDDLTVCVTTYKRPEKLARCLASIEAAGIKNVVVSHGDEYGGDIGCNSTWMLAAYRATTKRVVLLHDDDSLDPGFGEAYDGLIGPAMDRREAGFVSWNANLRYDDGTTKPCPFWEGPSTLMPAHNLLKVVGKKGTLSLSPIVSVLNRAILIRACKEAGEHLRANASLERPGMLLGTEIVVYMRHIQAFKRWLYLDKVLSYYGAGPESGTIKHQKAGTEGTIIEGYDLARDLGLSKPSEPTPRILLLHSEYEPQEVEAHRRHKVAKDSWGWHFGNADVIDLPFRQVGLPKIKAMLDHACKYALSEDIILYVNADVGLTTHAPERILAGVARGNGVTCCITRDLQSGWSTAHRKSVANFKAPGGHDAFAMTPAWWKAHRDNMPDFFIGREGWDNVLCHIAEEWAPGRSKTDDAIWHTPHDAKWKADRESLESTHNRELAVAYSKKMGLLL